MADAHRKRSRRSSGRQVPEPELYFAFVRALGTDLGALEGALVKAVKAAGYGESRIRLSALLSEVDERDYLDQSPLHERYKTHMDLGDCFRWKTNRNDAVALLGIRDIFRREGARRKQRNQRLVKRGWTYRIQSLMHPKEVRTLRQVYGSQLFVISAASPLATRLDQLSVDIARSLGWTVDECGPIARELLNRDAGILARGQLLEPHQAVARSEDYPSKPEAFVDVASTFQLADVFVSPNDLTKSIRAIERLVDLILSNPFHTPTKDEMAMYMAYGMALRSASLSRRVGAVIATKDGDIVAAGTNDVPKFGGGLYWAEEEPDHRDFKEGEDANDVAKRDLLMDVLNRLASSKWLVDELRALKPEELVKRAVDESEIRSARMMDAIEYGRSVHAEMAALSEAARRGVSVSGCSLFCTTFPCHECARHIVAAGIDRVVYIEAYPKSRVPELYKDSIGLAAMEEEVGDKVKFEPFVGIGPRRFVDLFSWIPRKKADVKPDEEGGVQDSTADDDLSGQIAEWDIATARPRGTIINREHEYAEAQASAVRLAEEKSAKLCNQLVDDFRGYLRETVDQEE